MKTASARSHSKSAPEIYHPERTWVGKSTLLTRPGSQIEKNKGLAPRRKKDVRNPRVKKRNKYAEKQKKLKSMKSVYSGGEGRGGYSGELTGIKSGLVKSVKL